MLTQNYFLVLLMFGPMLRSRSLVFGVWECWFRNVRGGGRQSGRLAPLFYSWLCDTGVVFYSTGFSDSLAEESQGGLE